jgi:HK97 family phage major capsid protein/HK97 family phage prohead protease
MPDLRPYIVRSLPVEEFRAEDNGDGLTFTGYAAVWDSPTLIDSWEGRFLESIRRGAFKKSLRESTPVLQFDHGSHPMIGSIPIGAITEVGEDDRGVFVKARLHSDPFFAPVREAIASGSIAGMSFRFQVIRDEWDHSADPPRRDLVEVRCPELGPVVFPAYSETEAGVRARAERYAAALAPNPNVPSAPAAGHPDEVDSTTTAPAPGHPVTPTEHTREEPPVGDTQPEATEFEGLSLDEVRNKMSEVGDELTRLDAKTNPTEADVKRSEDLAAVFERLASEERRQVIAQRRRSTAAILERARYSDTMEPVQISRSALDLDRDPMRDTRDMNPRRAGDPWEAARSIPTFGRSSREINADYKELAFRAVERMSGVNTATRERITEIVRTATDPRVAQFVVHGSDPAFVRAFEKVYAVGDIGQAMATFTPEERDAYQRASATVGTPSTGGALVPVAFDPSLIFMTPQVQSGLRQIATQKVTTRNVYQTPTATTGAWSYDAESAEVSDDNGAWNNPTITMRTARGFIPFTFELEQDADNLSGDLAEILVRGRDNLERDKFVLGATASGEPNGWLTAMRAATTKIVQTATQDVLALADVSNLLGQLPDSFADMATWFGNRRTFLTIKALDTSTNAWQDPANGIPPGLYGLPVAFGGSMPATLTAAANNDILGVGDFSQFYIVDRVGFQIEYVQHRFGANGRPTGERGWLAWCRHGCDVMNTDAFRLLRA